MFGGAYFMALIDRELWASETAQQVKALDIMPDDLSSIVGT